jgi:hypothetical protein
MIANTGMAASSVVFVLDRRPNKVLHMSYDQTDAIASSPKPAGSAPRLSRRDAMRGLAVAAASPLFAVVACRDAADIGSGVRSEMPATPGELRTLSPTQNATVTAMAEVILPETDTAGAASLRINEFIDLLLTEWVDDDARAPFLRAIDAIDNLARERYGSPFAACTGDQQARMIGDLDTQLTSMATVLRDWQEERAQGLLEAVRTGDPPRRMLDEPSDPSGYAFYQLKRFVLTGYFTSEVGLRQTGFTMIPERWDGCVEIAAPVQPGAED